MATATQAETSVFPDLNSESDTVFRQWLELNGLYEGAQFIAGVINDDCMVELPENFTPTHSLELPFTYSSRPLHTYRYLLLEYVYAGEGFLGQRFAWQLTATDDEAIAQAYYDRWEESLPED